MSDLPTVIRVGGTDYTVVERKDLRDGNTGLNGHILYNECEIRVEEAMTPHVKWVTVWHETLHGLLEHAGMGDHEEKLVLALGYGVTQALRDNPWLREPPGENVVRRAGGGPVNAGDAYRFHSPPAADLVLGDFGPITIPCQEAGKESINE